MAIELTDEMIAKWPPDVQAVVRLLSARITVSGIWSAPRGTSTIATLEQEAAFEVGMRPVSLLVVAGDRCRQMILNLIDQAIHRVAVG